MGRALLAVNVQIVRQPAERREKVNNSISSSLEDYLEAIFVLQQSGKDVRITDIASRLNVSKPSVNRAVGTLKQAELLTHESYGTILLTPEGETKAAQILRRHNMLKHFLSNTLGVSDDTAEADACRMEHVMSSETIEKLYDYLVKLDEE